MKLIAKKPFSWAHRGVTVEHFAAGAEIETEDADLIEVSTREGWVESNEEGKKRSAKAQKGAPENKGE